jgi:hypothetical protein
VAERRPHDAVKAGARGVDAARLPARSRADRELEEWIDSELAFYVKGLINDHDYAILRRNLIRIAQAERRRRG